MAIVENFATFMTDCGIDVVVGGVNARAIFDNAAADALGLVAGTKPVLLLATASVASAVSGDAVTAGGASYTIAEIQPDGTGMTRLILEEA